MHPSGVRWSRRPTFIFTCFFLLFAVSFPVVNSRVPSYKRLNLTSASTTPTSSSSGSVQSSSHSNHHQLRHLNNKSRHSSSSSSSSTSTFLTTVTSYVDTPSGLEVDQQEIVSLLTGQDEDKRDLSDDFGEVAASSTLTSVVNTSNNNNGRRRGGKHHGQQQRSSTFMEDEELEDDSTLSTTNSNSNNNNSNGRKHKHNQQQLQQKSLNHNNYHSQNHQTHHHNYHSNNNNYNSNNNNNNRNSYHNSYGVSNCSRCRMLEETINVTKEAIKMQILSKLGLKVAPNITKRALPRIPPLDHLLDMYNMQGDSPVAHNAFKPGPVFEEAEDDYHAKMQKIISFAQEPPVAWQLPQPRSNMAIQYFKFSHAVMVNKAVRANLWVYLNPSLQLLDTYVWLHVYKVGRSEQNMSGVLQEHVESEKVYIKPRKGTWFNVDIRKTVSEWFRYPHLNRGLIIQAYDSEGHQLVATERFPGVDTSLLPFMEVFVMDESKRRTKRMIGLNCEEGSPEVRCCRYPLKVDFEEFGWDWIIAPKSYEANYCSGECPFVFLQKYPHTHLVQQANPSGSAGPCCAPRKMSPISMLYFDHELNIIYGLLPGMVVDRCGCS